MTVLDAIKIALRRTGLDDANTQFQGNMRDYVNAILKDIEGEATWWWKFKTGTITTTKTMTIATSPANVSAGDTVTGQTSEATAIVDSVSSTSNVLEVKSEAGTFTAGENIKKGELAVGVFSSLATRRLYPLANDVQSIAMVFNETRNTKLAVDFGFMGQSRDFDLASEGNPELLYLWSLDSNNSNVMQVGLYPRDSASNESITYQYYAYTRDLTVSDNNESVDQYVYQPYQSALWHGAARLYLEEKGNEEDAQSEAAEYARVMQRARKNNLDVLGVRHPRRRFADGDGDSTGIFDFNVLEGSLT